MLKTIPKKMYPKKPIPTRIFVVTYAQPAPNVMSDIM